MTNNSQKQILIISHDKIGSKMAGPGIRYHYMGDLLSESFDVTIGFFDPTYLPDSDFAHDYRVTHVDKGSFSKSFENIDIVIAMWLSDEMLDYCQKHSIFTVVDMYAPVPVENLALFMFSGDPVTHNTDYYYKQSYNMYATFFEKGDLFLVSNRRQLDFWVGFVFGSDLIRVSSYLKRSLFERFIYAPMGIDTSQTLVHEKNVIRHVLPGVTDDDKVLLWTGGIWNWFDGQILVRAMAKIASSHPEIKLVFFGTKHPNPDVPAMKEAADTFALARELGLYEKTVFLHEDWVPYDERVNYLLEANVAVNTTKESIENEFSHRTRVLDHILTSLPTISTAGDYLSDDVIDPLKIGVSVPPADVDALADAIIRSTNDKKNKAMKKSIAAVRGDFDWEVTLSPLKDALLQGLPKLETVVIPRVKEMPKGSLRYKIAKRILPRKLKSVIVSVFKYGR